MTYLFMIFILEFFTSWYCVITYTSRPMCLYTNLSSHYKAHVKTITFINYLLYNIWHQRWIYSTTHILIWRNIAFAEYEFLFWYYVIYIVLIKKIRKPKKQSVRHYQSCRIIYTTGNMLHWKRYLCTILEFHVSEKCKSFKSSRI